MSVSTFDREGAEIARRVLDACLAGERWRAEDLRRLIETGSPALFSVLAEGLSDRFEPRLSDEYAGIFSEVIAAALPGCSAAELRARHERVRRPRRFNGDPRRVRRLYVLSRVTLGADVAVTSVVLDAARRRFPEARVVLISGRKSYELFAGDPRIEWLNVSYRRSGTLRERLEGCPRLGGPGTLVIDPDSRLTQLGLLPVCPEENYFLFESRSYGGGGSESLACLTARWLEETFEVAGARPFIAPVALSEKAPEVAVSLGVGENPAKRVPDPFEAGLLAGLAERFDDILVDTGAGGEEAERVARAIALCGACRGRVRTWQGSFASFAGLIARSRLYVGYDSAGQHAAAACGVPLVTVFAGFPCERFLARWRPTGPGPAEVVRGDVAGAEDVLARTLAAVDRIR